MFGRTGPDQDILRPLHSVLAVLPTLNCLTPVAILNHMNAGGKLADDTCPLLFDPSCLKSDLIQRPCQYLKAYDAASQQFDTVNFKPDQVLSDKECLQLMLRHLENPDPSWSEIIHFASFLNAQLADSEKSVFCQQIDVLPGFKTFVVKFMVQMAHDFAQRSLEISDCSALRLDNTTNRAEINLEQLRMRRRWENDPHPYLFFNPDGHTFTFFGFNVNLKTGQLIGDGDKVLFDDKIKLAPKLING